MRTESVKNWAADYLDRQKKALNSVDPAAVADLVELLFHALNRDAQIFGFGNGGSASNISHWATDLGKGSSDALERRFRVLSLNDNVSWMTAISNDYSYDDIFVRQLENYARPGDIALALSVSGNSPNVVKALEWAKAHNLITIALIGGKNGRAAQIADHSIVIPDNHYGRSEDVQMTICHMLCYAFMELKESFGV